MQNPRSTMVAGFFVCILVICCTGDLIGNAEGSSGYKNSSLSDDVIVFEFRTSEFQVPTDIIYYNCRYIKMDLPPVKHHLIKFEPVIQPGNEGLVHHATLFFCTLLGHEEMNKDANCNTLDLNSCETFIAWTTGGKAFTYPESVGHDVPMGNVGFILELHYHNQEKKSAIVDSSGLRLYLTPNVRKYDAASLGIGALNDKYLIVPPLAQNFVYRGYCDASCTNRALESQDIHIFAVLLHCHGHCREIRIRHFQNGVELPPVIEDKNYHSQNQSIRLLSAERTLKKGQSLVVECSYDTREVTEILHGGLVAVGEDCVSLIFYYPKISWPICISSVYYHIDGRPVNSDIFKITQTMNWNNPKVREDFQHVVSTSPFALHCVYNNQTLDNIIPVSNVSPVLEARH
ncbi:DBH-like monooxygenase protein 1 [Bulinus truncatus]|nr:DBH-like monooxygenase protein 1 [Bulinus truncatus]